MLLYILKRERLNENKTGNGHYGITGGNTPIVKEKCFATR